MLMVSLFLGTILQGHTSELGVCFPWSGRLQVGALELSEPSLLLCQLDTGKDGWQLSYFRLGEANRSVYVCKPVYTYA